jgi:hypothetical protein
VNPIKAAILAMLKALGVDVDAKKTEIDAALKPIDDEVEKLSKPSEPPNPSPAPPASSDDAISRAVKAALEPYQAKFDTLSVALENERKARETATSALDAERKEQQKKEREKIVDEAIATGKLTKEQRDAWLERLEASHDSVKAILDEMPPNPAVNRGKDKPGEKPANGITIPGTNDAQQGYRAVQQEALSLLSPESKN